MSTEEQLQVLQDNINRIAAMLRSHPQDWYDYIATARSTISSLDSTMFAPNSIYTDDHIRTISVLQQLAFIDIEHGSIPDILAWCLRRWLALYEQDPQNVSALRGMGQVWLARAQPALARVHQGEHTTSLRTSAGPQHWMERSSTLWMGEDEGYNGWTASDAEYRAGVEAHVEARVFLIPATDFFDRAVAAARAEGSLSGDLLVMVRLQSFGYNGWTIFKQVCSADRTIQTAEAYMSLGDTSSPRINEPFFRRALHLLRDATAVPGYRINWHLQRYLEDYGRLID